MSEGLYVTNDILLHLNQNEGMCEARKDSNEVEYLANIDVENVDNESDVVISNEGSNLCGDTKAINSNNVIHVLNIEGSLLNISKETNAPFMKKRSKNGKHLVNMDDYFQTTLAYKCLKCDHLCEDKPGILRHIHDVHLITVEDVRICLIMFNWLEI